ncbi:MAG: Y-family DNA polymerase, partial [Synergistales bacterium]|nr:Y-family DNA polymerase [Synergistales bacterium]
MYSHGRPHDAKQRNSGQRRRAPFGHASSPSLLHISYPVRRRAGVNPRGGPGRSSNGGTESRPFHGKRTPARHPGLQVRFVQGVGGGDVGHPGAVLKPCADLLALCDCNNFFVSCERLFRPDLEGRPVVVLSSNDGVVIARSNEVKALGVKMGEPYFRVRSFLERHDTAVFSSNFRLYEEVSARVMASLRRFTPSMEVYSVDEAFLEIPPEGKRKPAEWARDVRAAVLRETGIPVSVGAAPTKTAAKLAAERAKKRPETGGGFALLPGGAWDDLLGEVPVEDVWGIGRRWSDFLRRRGISTALRLRDAPDDRLEKHLGVRGLRTAWE